MLTSLLSLRSLTGALVFWLLFSGITPLYASDYYWVGGSGNWSDINHWATTSGGGTKHVVVPSPNDHVFFDANSFTGANQSVYVDLSIATCKNLSIGNVGNTPAFVGGNQLKIYGSLTWSKKMNWQFSGKVFFEAVNPGNTIQTDSITFTNDVIFQGLGGSWTLLNILKSTQRIYLEYGSLNTNGKTMECTGFFSTSPNTRGLTLGSSVIKLTMYWSVNLLNLTLSAGQSKIFFSGTGTFSSTGSSTGTYHIVYFNGTSGTSSITSTQSVFTSVRFAGGGIIGGNNNFDTLFFTPGRNYIVNGISTIYKKFDADGNCVSPIGISGSWALTMPSSAIFLVNYIRMTGITATGGANFSTNGSIDLGGNSGIIFIPLTPFVLYWVGGSGEWNDTTHWSYSSGGPGGACIPTAIDDVWFDANSFSLGDSVSISDLTAECHDMHWVSIPDSIKLNKLVDLYIHGSVWLHHNLIWNGGSSQTFFVSNQPGETILSDSTILTGPVYFDGTGSWTLLDDFEIEGHGVEHQTGTWNTAGKRVKIGVYHSFTSNQRVLNLGSSHFIVYTSHVQAWSLMGLNYTLNAGTSTVDIAGPDGGIYNSSSFGLTYYHVIFSDSSGLGQLNTDQNNFFTLTFKSNGFIRGLNTIGTLNFTKGKDYKLAYNNTQTIQTQLNAIGGCDGYILIHSDEKDYTTTISKQSGIVNCEYLIMWNVNATGGAVFNANNSVDVAMNTGWNFTSPTAKNLYWVGGTGNWSDVMHWSLTSGGVGGACVPSPLDSVFFDGNSFLAANDTVYVDLTNATCHTMTWKDSLDGAILYGDAYKTMWFWGSVIFDTAMMNQFQGLAMFEASDTGHILVAASNWFILDVIFEGRGGSWTIVDSLNVMRNILLKHGALNGAGKLIQAGSLRSPLSSKRGLDISSAEVKLFGSTLAWELMHDSLVFDATESELIFLSAGFVDFNNYSGLPDTADFHNITFLHDFSFASMFSNNIYCRMNVATYGGNGNFNESFRYDSLMMTGGHTYKFAGGTTQIFNHLSAAGTCFRPIVFTPMLPVSPPVPQYNLHNLGAAAQINYVTIDGCTGIGPSTYLASNSVDNGANLNWTVTPVGPVDLYWVNGTGSWWDPYHWSYTSGGIGGACIPTFRDNVFFDQNSFLTPQDTVSVDSLFAECHDMQWINITTNPTFRLPGVPLDIYGALRLDTAINGEFQGKIRFLSNHGGNYIYCGSQIFEDSVVFHGSGNAAWTLYDSLTALESINLISGNLNTNGQTVSGRMFLSYSTNARTLTLDTTLFKVMTLWRLNGNNLTLNPGHSTIEISAANPQMISEHGTGFHYHNVIFTSITGTSVLRTNIAQTTYNKVQINNNGTIYGEHLFDSLLMMPGNLYMLEKGKTQTITSYWLLRGNNCFPLTLQSTQLGQQAIVKKTSGQVVGDFVHMRDIDATGGATFFAGDNSSDVSNNTGWNFNNSPGYIFGLGPDIQFTIGSTITISTANFNGGPGTTYQWSTGATTPNITVSQPDTYIVTVTYAGNCVVIDTIIVFCDVKPQFNIGHCICFGDNTGWINMSILDTVGTYQAVWSNGANQLNLNGLTAGQYSVIVYGSTGCNGKDTIQIHEPPPVVVPLSDTSFCEDDTGVLLDATTSFTNYWWNGVPGGHSLFVSQEDTIVVVVEDADGCFSAPDTIVVTIDTIPWIWLGDDAEICLGESLTLNPGAGFDAYLWQDGSTKQLFTATQGGVYAVTIKLRTCLNHDTILLFDCPPEIFFPNVFTPNGDGTNDFFYPIHQNIYNYQLVIFNRWGAIVFSTEDPYEKWDGTSNGIPNSEGTYFYTVDYLGFGQRAIPGRKLHRGTITLLR
jgi:gliding motility-associated-like protein